MRRIVIAEPAEDDLDSISDFIAEDSPAEALRVIREIRSAISLIGLMPGMGHPRTEVRDQAFRFWSVYSYLIVYQYDDNEVVVYKVIHGARDLREIFDD